MKYISEYRDPTLAKGLVAHISAQSTIDTRFMEFCGGHTATIFRYGIRQVLPETISLVSGPGCPVCVTATEDLDIAIELASIPHIILATFGDMLKVPGSRSSLQQSRASGSDVRIVYSAMDAVRMAKNNPDRSIVFLGIGFETTAPTVAASLVQAQEENISNYYIHSMHKLCPPVIRTLLDSGETKLDGLICPGHVSMVTGAQAWEFIAEDYGIPCVVSGFEPLDILQCIDMLTSQAENGNSEVEIAYRRGVTHAGNTTAQALMDEVFIPSVANWRGIGKITDSGLVLRDKYKHFDALEKFSPEPGPTLEPPGCMCGEILRGIATPHDCPLFKDTCTPEQPIGPCMVSSEGSCATYYRYGDRTANDN